MFEDGGRPGQFFYRLSAPDDVRSTQQKASCGCLNWYREDIEMDPVPATEPCPCTLRQARFDWRFTPSVDFWFRLINSFFRGFTGIRTADTELWDLDRSRDCFQRFSGRGPRCCYRSFFSR